MPFTILNNVGISHPDNQLEKKLVNRKLQDWVSVYKQEVSSWAQGTLLTAVLVTFCPTYHIPDWRRSRGHMSDSSSGSSSSQQHRCLVSSEASVLRWGRPASFVLCIVGIREVRGLLVDAASCCGQLPSRLAATALRFTRVFSGVNGKLLFHFSIFVGPHTHTQTRMHTQTHTHTETR